MSAGAELPVGVHDGVLMEQYLARLAFSSGMAHRLLTRSPLHAWIESPWNPNRETDDTAASDIGTIAHDVLLSGGTGIIARIDPNDYPAEKTGAIPAGWTNKAIRAARDAARANGKIPLFPADVAAVAAMVESANSYVAHSQIAGVFDTGKPEQTIVWSDDGLLCKARPDWLNADVCLHLKTTKMSVNPPSFDRTAINMGYDISLAFYARACDSIRDADSTEHVILAIEQEPPYACKLFALSAAQWEISQRRVARAINAWSACMKSKHFPAYTGDVHLIEPTSWQLAQAEQDAASDPLTDEELKDGVPL